MAQDTRGPFLTATEAATLRGVSYRQVLRAVRTGDLSAQHIGRTVVITRPDLERWYPGRCPPPLADDLAPGPPGCTVAPQPWPPPAPALDTELARVIVESGRQRVFLEQLIAAAPVGIAVVEGPDHRFRLANKVYRSYKHNPDILGKTFVQANP